MQPHLQCHALVIEDDEQLAHLFAETLRGAGLRTTIAFDGMTGLEAQDRDPADLVLLDLKLPDMDGGDVALDLRCRFPQTQIVAVTGDPTRLAAPALVALVLQKPVRAAELRRLARELSARGPILSWPWAHAHSRD